DGEVRIGTTRVLLPLVIEAFRDGTSPEGIVQMYSSLQLADVHAVIAYYLRHQAGWTNTSRSGSKKQTAFASRIWPAFHRTASANICRPGSWKANEGRTMLRL